MRGSSAALYLHLPIGESPSGKAAAFGAAIRRFESSLPSHLPMARFLLICLGGALGTGARYLISLWLAGLAGAAFPLGTLVVNVAGSFLLAAIVELSLATALIGPDARLILGTGVLGGFTTYSTFNYETLALLREGTWGLAALNIAATLAGCLIAGAIGIALIRAVVH